MARHKSKPLTEHPKRSPSPEPSVVTAPLPANVTRKASVQKETSITNKPAVGIPASKIDAGTTTLDVEKKHDGKFNERNDVIEPQSQTLRNVANPPNIFVEGGGRVLDYGKISSLLNDLSPHPSNSPPENDDDDELPGPYEDDEVTLYPESSENYPAPDGIEIPQVRLPKITDPEKFAESIEDAEDMDYDKLFGRVSNIFDVLVTLQDEWLDLEYSVKNTTLERPDTDLTRVLIEDELEQKKHETEKEKPPVFSNPRLPKPQFLGVGYQDLIESFVYGYQHSSHPSLLGTQNPIKQRILDDTNGRLLRQRVPTHKAADAETETDSEETGQLQRTRGGQRKLYDSDNVGVESGRGARVRIPSSRFASEAPEQTSFRTFTSGKRVGRPPTESKAKPGHQRLQALKPPPNDYNGQPPPFAENTYQTRPVASRASTLNDTGYWPDRPGQSVFDSRPGTSSTTVTENSTQSSDSQPSYGTDPEYIGGRRQRQNTSDFEDTMSYHQRVQRYNNDMTSVPTSGSLQSTQDDGSATGKSVKRSEGGKQGWIKRRERAAAEKAKQLNEQPATQAGFGGFGAGQLTFQSQSLAPAPGNSTDTTEPIKTEKTMSRSERSRLNQLNAWKNDDGSRREKSSKAMTARWAEIKARGGTGTLAGTTTKPKPPAAAATSAPVDTPSTITPAAPTDNSSTTQAGAQAKPAKGVTPASRNMLQRWKKRKEAEERGEIPPKIGRIKKSAKDKDGQLGDVQPSQSVDIAPAITPAIAPATEDRKRKRDEDDTNPDQSNTAEVQAQPPKRRIIKLINTSAQPIQDILNAQTSLEAQASAIPSNIDTVSKASEPSGRRAKKAAVPTSAANASALPVENLDPLTSAHDSALQAASVTSLDNSHNIKTEPNVNGPDVNSTEPAEPAFQPRKSGRVRRETSVARSYQSERRSSKSSQKRASTPAPAPTSDEVTAPTHDDMTSIPTIPTTRSRRQSKASTVDGFNPTIVPAEAIPEAVMPAPANPKKRSRAGKSKANEVPVGEAAAGAENALDTIPEPPLKKQRSFSATADDTSAVAPDNDSTAQQEPTVPAAAPARNTRRPKNATSSALTTPARQEEEFVDEEPQAALQLQQESLTPDMNNPLDEEAQRKAAAKAAKSAKMSENLRARWASGSMAGAVAKRKATAAAKRAADPSSASSKKKRSAESTPNPGSDAPAPPPKRARRATARAQTDGADDDSDADTPRKMSEYETFLALSSPTGSPLGRGRRPAALKASQSFSRYDDQPEDDFEDDDSEISRQFASEYDAYQALTSPDQSIVLGKRVRKPVMNLKEAMAIEAGADDDLDFEV